MPNEPARLVELRTSIARRLRAVCSAMPPHDFDGLVQRIAEIEYKYEQLVLGYATAEEMPQQLQ
jgi:hypothetical protein